jgi:hypothetical protein
MLSIFLPISPSVDFKSIIENVIAGPMEVKNIKRELETIFSVNISVQSDK